MLVIANILGWIAAHRRWLIYGIAGIVLALVLFIVGSHIWSWAFPPPKLNEQEIQLGERAIEQHNDALLRNVIANSEARTAEIDATLDNTEAQIKRNQSAAEDKWRNASREELQAEFDRRRAASGDTQ